MIDITCSIVLFHNPVDEVRKAIESFLSSPKNIKIYLVDNSKDDSLRYEFISPRLEYIFTGRNLGFGAGHNIAIEKAKKEAKYHLILNPDIEFDPQTLTRLFHFMEQREDIGLVMPKVLYRTGEIQYLCKKLPSPADLFLRRFIPPAAKFLFKKTLAEYELKDKDYNSPMDVPNLSGCFMFIRSKVFFEIGLFDEQYFLYLEDTDLCRRINKYYRTVYYPTVSVIHGYSKLSYKNFKSLYYHLTSSVRYFNKWGWFNDKKRILINRSIITNTLNPFLQNSATLFKKRLVHTSSTRNETILSPIPQNNDLAILNNWEGENDITFSDNMKQTARLIKSKNDRVLLLQEDGE